MAGIISDLVDLIFGRSDDSEFYNGMTTWERRRESRKLAHLLKLEKDAKHVQFTASERKPNTTLVNDPAKYFSAGLLLFTINLKRKNTSDRHIESICHDKCMEIIPEWFSPTNRYWNPFISECTKNPILKAIVPSLATGEFAKHLEKMQSQKKAAEEKAKAEDAEIVAKIKELREEIYNSDRLAMKYAREGERGRCYSEICSIESAQKKIYNLKKKLNQPIDDAAADNLRTG